MHRYSFDNGSLSDSVGGRGWDASLVGGASVRNNKLMLMSQGQYVNLPSGLLAEYSAVSLEAWVTTGSIGGWPRIFQFGEIFNSKKEHQCELCHS